MCVSLVLGGGGWRDVNNVRSFVHVSFVDSTLMVVLLFNIPRLIILAWIDVVSGVRLFLCVRVFLPCRYNGSYDSYTYISNQNRLIVCLPCRIMEYQFCSYQFC